MPNVDLYLSVFFVVGVLVVVTFAWQRFNEPSFPNRKALPRTLFPVRYLFLRSSYRRARLTYVGAMLLLYCILVAPGGGRVFVIQESIVHSFSPAFAAGLMYGSVVFIALRYRSIQIDNRVWRENSAICLIGIAVRAGLVTWAVIIVTTFLFQYPTETWQWWVDHASFVTSYFGGHESDSFAGLGWGFLPVKMATALPWLLVGGTASAVLASCAGGDVRIDKPHRLTDAIILGIAVGLAAATAQLIQTSFSQFQFQEADAPPLAVVPVIGLAGAICGAVIGFMVPQAYRASLVRPHNREMDKTLRDLLRKAEAQLVTRAAAEEWVFEPNDALGGIAPAEAMQYQTQSNGVETLLAQEAPRPAQENSPRPPEAGGTHGNGLAASPVPVDPGIVRSPGLVPAIAPSDPRVTCNGGGPMARTSPS
jgi:hypothetical protein